jgi:hypothetical protein
MSVLFISENSLRENSLINDNVDMKSLTPTIIYCQDEYIQFAIGSDLFNELKDQIEAGTTTALNRTLLDDYIRPCLIWYILSEAVFSISYKFTNKGVVQQSSDNSKPVSLEGLLKLHDRYKNRAEMYRERLRRYLVQNEESYPKFYRESSNDIDTIRPQNYSYTTGLFLGDNNLTNNGSSFSDRYQGNYDSECDS